MTTSKDSGTGAEQMLAELDKVLLKIKKDLQKVGTSDAEFKIITNEVVMDAVMKLINLVDKIKKISNPTPEPDSENPAENGNKKIANLQDWTLQKNKA